MTEPARDPRVDPRPGDVVVSSGHALRVDIVTESQVYFTSDRIQLQVGVEPIVWRNLIARGGEVVARGDET